jgi:hypothetical protein
MRRGFCFVRAKSESEKEQELSKKHKQHKTGKKQTRLPPGLFFKCLTTHCKALQRAKCGFTHTSFPLHGRMPRLSWKSRMRIAARDSAPQTPQNGGNHPEN